MNGPENIDSLMLELRKIEDYSFNKVLNIYLYLHKHVQNFPSCLSDRNETGMSIVNQQIAVHLVTCKIIDTTSSVSNISHNNDFNGHDGKLSEDVVDYACKEHQALRKLK